VPDPVSVTELATLSQPSDGGCILLISCHLQDEAAVALSVWSDAVPDPESLLCLSHWLVAAASVTSTSPADSLPSSDAVSYKASVSDSLPLSDE
jgi:hypothetical protein